ncbi:hypothetical protein BsWGS_24792 [Bradybaena similaris]
MSVPEVSKQSALKSVPWKPSNGTLPKIEYVDHVTSYEDFFQNILLKNQLCIIGSEATADWTSRKNWVASDGRPNFAYLLKHFGESVAPVADCNSEEFCAHPKTEMTVRDYLAYWQSYRSQDHPQSKSCLYLKDWHFVRDFPGYSVYQTPIALCSDWMNEFWDVWEGKGQTDDYRFVYMGPAGSWTPFHADVLHSYSWSTNICGKKKWIFFPPGAEKGLKDKRGHLVFDLRSADLQDPQKYPEGSSAVDAAITMIQNPGEVIFVPSGWHHEVFNLEDTISINHNWINGCSAHLTWQYLKNRLLAIQKEIEDCRNMEGWHQHCQVMLKADSGIHYTDFYAFMARIATHRVTALNKFIESRSTRDPPNVSSSFSGTQSSESQKQRHRIDKNDDSGDDKTDTDSKCQLIHEDDTERHESQNCCHTLSNGKQAVPAFADQAALENQHVSSTIKKDHSSNHLSVQPQSKPSSCDNIGIHDVRSQPFDSNDFCKATPNCFKSTSRSQHNSQVFSYLCLFTGTVVHVGKKVCQNNGIIQNNSERPCDDHYDDDDDHRRCPHWAHTGPNLALFDLRQVLDIVKDMQDCEEFKFIMEEQHVQEMVSIPPTELVVQVERTIRRMMHGSPLTR